LPFAVNYNFIQFAYILYQKDVVSGRIPGIDHAGIQAITLAGNIYSAIPLGKIQDPECTVG
jgi:hypothetical protein